MHKSATLKLTAWYLLILMSISLLFSIIIYQVADSEINTRLNTLQQKLQRESDIFSFSGTNIRSMSLAQANQAAFNLFITLVYINILVLASGGIGSYLLARRTLEPIERAYEAQYRFTSDASHELRTPLAAMKTELEVALRDSAMPRSEMKELLKSNLEEVNKLTQLSHMLLQLSRFENTGLEKAKVAADDVIKSVVNRYDKTGQRIRVALPAKRLYVEANPVSLEELLTILVDNAIKYSPVTSVVDVVVAKKNKYVSVKIKNDGQGISSKDLPHIFDRFYRIDSSRTGGSKSGYGLGLSLAKKIVELHNGVLTASSSPHSQTTFTVLLPRYRSAHVS